MSTGPALATEDGPSQINQRMASQILTFVDGNPQYELLGCYNELGPDEAGPALGLTGEYFSPQSASPKNLTVSLCLKGCGAALAPNGGGPYKFAAVENSRYVCTQLFLASLLPRNATFREVTC